MTKVKVWIIFLFCLLPCCSTTAFSQNVISHEKVKELFLKQDSSLMLDGLDCLLLQQAFFKPNRAMNTVGRLHLPPSEWAWLVGNEKTGYTLSLSCPIRKEGENRLLCWKRLRNSTNKEDDAVLRKLEKKFGSIRPANDTALVVPALWLSDTIVAFSNPKYYDGLWTCNTDSMVVNHGDVVLIKNNPWDYFDQSAHDGSSNTLAMQMQDLAPELCRSFDSDRASALMQYVQMTVLAYEVNSHCAMSFCNPHVVAEFPIYVGMGKDGKCSMTLLDDHAIKDADSAYVAELQHAFQEMPPLFFPLKNTIEGEMVPGCILYAKRNFAWTFRETGYKKFSLNALLP